MNDCITTTRTKQLFLLEQLELVNGIGRFIVSLIEFDWESIQTETKPFTHFDSKFVHQFQWNHDGSHFCIVTSITYYGDKTLSVYTRDMKLCGHHQDCCTQFNRVIQWHPSKNILLFTTYKKVNETVCLELNIFNNGNFSRLEDLGNCRYIEVVWSPDGSTFIVRFDPSSVQCQSSEINAYTFIHQYSVTTFRLLKSSVIPLTTFKGCIPELSWPTHKKTFQLTTERHTYSGFKCEQSQKPWHTLAHGRHLFSVLGWNCNETFLACIMYGAPHDATLYFWKRNHDNEYTKVPISICLYNIHYNILWHPFHPYIFCVFRQAHVICPKSSEVVCQYMVQVWTMKQTSYFPLEECMLDHPPTFDYKTMSFCGLCNNEMIFIRGS